MKIVVMIPCREDSFEKLRQAAGENSTLVKIAEKEGSERRRRELEDAEIVIGEPSLEEIKNMKKLKWVQISWAGTEIYTQHPGFPHNVIFTNATGAFGMVISEYVLGGILQMYRRFPEYQHQQQEHLWKRGRSEKTLFGKTALIIGAGNIGTETAVRLKAFGVKTIGIRRVEREKPDCFDAMYTLDQLDRLLPEADLVIGCIPNTKETAGLMNEKRLFQMKKEALLVNVGRGSLIVTEDLCHVLKSGHLYGVVLDVTSPEPLPEDHPLWNMKNVMITPHISGVSFGLSSETEDKILEICCENLRRFLGGKRLQNVIDFETGYRSIQEG